MAHPCAASTTNFMISGDDLGDAEDDGDFADDGFDSSDRDQDEPDDDVDVDVETDEYEGPGWQEIAISGAMADEIAEEKRRRDRIGREMIEDEPRDSKSV